MTIEQIENFTLPSYTNKVIRLYSDKLIKVEERPGFYEDVATSSRVRRPVLIQDKDTIEFSGNETEEEKEAIVTINHLMALTKEAIEDHYGTGPLNNFEGGVAKLVEGAFNGLHSDVYNPDGTRYDGDGRGDDLKYSALLYLSEFGKDFTGGELYFPKQDLTIRPQKGLLVFFPGDLDHVHEVKKVTSGERYAIVMFFG